jgi:hypothetical protein
MALYYADVNECTSAPCVNGGACVDQINGYLCNCLANFMGQHCEIGKINSILTTA